MQAAGLTEDGLAKAISHNFSAANVIRNAVVNVRLWKIVDVTIGWNNKIVIDGTVGDWQTLRDSLAGLTESQRKQTVIAIKAASPDLPVGEYFEQQVRASAVVKDLGLAYLSIAGVEDRGKKVAERQVDVLGLVEHPGSYSLPADRQLTVKSIIASAGLLHDDTLVVNVLRSKGTVRNPMREASIKSLLDGSAPDMELEPDDVVIVGQPTFYGTPPAAVNPIPPMAQPGEQQNASGVVYVGGAVARQGTYSIDKRRVTVTQIIIAAGGPQNSSIGDGTALVEVRRRSGSEEQTVVDNVSLDSMFTGKNPDPYIKSDDIILVRKIVPKLPPSTQPESP